MADSEMWSEADVRTELKDAKKVKKQSREVGDVGQSVYWSGYVRALEVVLNDGKKGEGAD